MDLTSIKVISAFVLIILTFTASILPLCIFRQPISLYDPRARARSKLRKRILSFLNCFAGGVFLGTCLLHLFPDVEEQVHTTLSKLMLPNKYPITEFLLGFGFLTIFIVDQITVAFKNDLSHDESPLPEEQRPIVCQASANDLEESTENNDYISTTYGAIQGNNEPSEFNITFSQENNSDSTFHSLLLLFSLSLHSIFEGLAIGLQSTIKDDLRILLAVSIHKCIIAFSLGLNLTHSNMRLLIIIKSNIFFALSSPVGILLGVAVLKFASGLTLLVTSSVLQGLAAGTFLYITLFEILPDEFRPRNDPDRTLKVLAVILGYGVVCFLIIFLPD